MPPESEVEETHWWFIGRRSLIEATIRRGGVAASARILDVGAGTGSNLRLLSRIGFEQVWAVDRSPIAAAYCQAHIAGRVQVADAKALPFADGGFDCVLATDVIEHVDDDDQALSEIARVLRPGGTAVIMVPAFPSLWGISDEVGRHYRRYRLRPLVRIIEGAGLSVSLARYFNYILFVPIWLLRVLMRAFNIRPQSEGDLNTAWLNRVLTWLFLFDVRTAMLIRPPFGVSILAVCRKPNRDHAMEIESAE
ncbi:MAG: class I SAM-dependent methyltransferase [Proteobacteria bacterium]|nr:class I SAM-dependent methyltransferase [Pseudomonadota bacterium]MBI3497204.1 class I SAM-dependent methyltransferase [Pseudomonadota bacterium]